MGKLQDGGKTDVKREVVSANLEVISQESFVKRLEGMSSACHNCHRERTRSQRNKPGRKGKAGRRKQQGKSNMPIVIHLKDTLRSSGKLWHSSHDGDSDVSARSTDEDQYTSSSSSSGQSTISKTPSLDYHISSIYGDVASIPEFVPQYQRHHFHQTWHQTFYHHVPLIPSNMFSHPAVIGKSPYHSFISTAQKAKEKSRKNLTALISVIEKAHRKEARDIEPNLSSNSTGAKLSNVLNNVSLSSQTDSEIKRKNMAECDNVELICNDLSTSADKLAECDNVELICNDLSTSADRLAESTGESDSSDKVSVVSSTDTLSDDAADPAVFDEIRGRGLTSNELEQLAEYTVGAPLIRYDCQPSQCPECVSALYSYQYFQNEVCNFHMAPKPSSNFHNSRHYLHSHVQQQQHRLTSRTGQRQKVAVSPRTSISSDSDGAASDVEDSSTTSSSSSLSSSSNKTAASSTMSFNKTSSKATQPPKASKNPRSSTALKNHQEVQDKKPIKRATASWKSARQLWDIDVSKAHRRPHLLDSSCMDSVYMDLTGLDVSISVMYHTEPPAATPTWPYPVHSLYAMYSPTIPAPTLGFSTPFRFSNQMMNTHSTDTIPLHELKKYEISSPPHRPWITVGTPDKDVSAAVFSVMCYNVLCDKLCTKAMYAYCPTWALSWNYRKKGIMNDILRGNADIITLQEVETEQYYSMFLPELAQQDYDGIFLPKSRVRTMNSDKEKKLVDGCAIFFKKTKFEKVSEHHIEFSQLATKEGASNTDTDMINRVSTKDNIAVVAVLRTKPGAYENSPVPPSQCLTQMLMVSTAHIHWDPQSPDVKLVQTMMLIEELQKFVKEASVQFRPNAPPPAMDADLCNSIPLILCGDFNSLPDSGVYEYLSKGKLDTNHKDFDGQNYPAFMKDRNDNGSITHNFNLTSAYKDVIPFTNYTFDFKGVIDYVFYSHQHLRLHGVMGLQDEEWFRVNKIVGCPHPFVPSDHFPLFAEFSLPVSPPLLPR